MTAASSIGQTIPRYLSKEGAKSLWKNAGTQQRLMAGTGLLDLVVGRGGIFETGLNLFGIASFFYAPLLLPVALCYLARSGWDLLKGVGCLVTGNFTGAVANFFTAFINGASALPFSKLKGAYNMLKARSSKVLQLEGEALKNFALDGSKSIFSKESLAAIETNFDRIKSTVDSITKKIGELTKDFVKVEDKLAKACSTETERVLANGKKLVSSTKTGIPLTNKLIFQTRERLGTEAGRIREALKTADAQAKEVLEKELEKALAKKKVFEERFKEWAKIRRDIKAQKIMLGKWQPFYESATQARSLASNSGPCINELEPQIRKLHAQSLYEVSVDPKLFLEKATRLSFGGKAAKFVRDLFKEGPMNAVKNFYAKITGKVKDFRSGIPTTKISETIASIETSKGSGVYQTFANIGQKSNMPTNAIRARYRPDTPASIFTTDISQVQISPLAAA